MRKLAISAAAIALSLGAHAAASPFGLNTGTDAKDETARAESQGPVSRLIAATTGTLSLIFGEKEEEPLLHPYYQENETCESEETAETEAAPEDEEQKAPRGPEPIYFGF